MLKTIKLQTSRLYAQKSTRSFNISLNALSEFTELKSRSQQMLIDILSLVGFESNIDSLTVEISYQELGFSSYSNMRKYRKELIDKRWLFNNKNEYYINPCKINYYTRRQQQFLFGLFKINKNKVVMNEPKIIRMVQ